MNLVIWIPVKGGTRTKQFKSLRRAKDFAKHICKESFINVSYLYAVKHGVKSIAQQWQNGKLRHVWETTAEDYKFYTCLQAPDGKYKLSSVLHNGLKL